MRFGERHVSDNEPEPGARRTTLACGSWWTVEDDRTLIVAYSVAIGRHADQAEVVEGDDVVHVVLSAPAVPVGRRAVSLRSARIPLARPLGERRVTGAGARAEDPDREQGTPHAIEVVRAVE